MVSFLFYTLLIQYATIFFLNYVSWFAIYCFHLYVIKKKCGFSSLKPEIIIVGVFGTPTFEIFQWKYLCFHGGLVKFSVSTWKLAKLLSISYFSFCSLFFFFQILQL